MLSRIRKWWADRKLARRAREAPRWASGGYVGNSPRFERGGYVDNGPLLPSEPFFVAPIYRSECPPPHERSHDDGRCQVIPIAEEGKTLQDCEIRLTNHIDAHSIVGPNIADTHCHAPSSDQGGSHDSGGSSYSSSCDSGSSSDSGGSSDSGCSGGGGD
jgi:hypothetical protein